MLLRGLPASCGGEEVQTQAWGCPAGAGDLRGTVRRARRRRKEKPTPLLHRRGDADRSGSEEGAARSRSWVPGTPGRTAAGRRVPADSPLSPAVSPRAPAGCGPKPGPSESTATGSGALSSARPLRRPGRGRTPRPGETERRRRGRDAAAVAAPGGTRRRKPAAPAAVRLAHPLSRDGDGGPEAATLAADRAAPPGRGEPDGTRDPGSGRRARGAWQPAPLTSSFRERFDTFFSILAAVFSAPRPFFSFLPFLPIAPVRGGTRTPRAGGGAARRAGNTRSAGRRAERRHFRPARALPAGGPASTWPWAVEIPEGKRGSAARTLEARPPEAPAAGFRGGGRRPPRSPQCSGLFPAGPEEAGASGNRASCGPPDGARPSPAELAAPRLRVRDAGSSAAARGTAVLSGLARSPAPCRERGRRGGVRPPAGGSRARAEEARAPGSSGGESRAPSPAPVACGPGSAAAPGRPRSARGPTGSVLGAGGGVPLPACTRPSDAPGRLGKERARPSPAFLRSSDLAATRLRPSGPSVAERLWDFRSRGAPGA